MIVVMSMAGRGSRFAGHGVARPKPLIPVAGKPMFAWALRSLDGLAYSRVVFVVLVEHEGQFGVTHNRAGPADLGRHAHPRCLPGR